MHNRLYIGLQRLHLRVVLRDVELCPRCHIENNIIHLFLNCPAVTEAWRLLQLEWEILLRLFKEELELTNNNNLDISFDEFVNISDNHKLFGIPTTSKSNFFKYITLQTLDIFLGNMQYTIIQQFRREQPMTPEERQEHDYSPVPLTSGSLFYEWRYHMKESLLLLITRMKYRDYKNQLIYSKPTVMPESVMNIT